MILNNSRLLIFPWVNVKNLASKSLSIISKQIADDAERDHGYRPVLLETFADPSKDNSPKDIYIYPLTNNFRSIPKNEISSKTYEEQDRNISEKKRELKTNDAFIRLWQKIMDLLIKAIQNGVNGYLLKQI